jgi:hypothetical protein
MIILLQVLASTGLSSRILLWLTKQWRGSLVRLTAVHVASGGLACLISAIIHADGGPLDWSFSVAKCVGTVRMVHFRYRHGAPKSAPPVRQRRFERLGSSAQGHRKEAAYDHASTTGNMTGSDALGQKEAPYACTVIRCDADG